jgi:hypothetical protein
MWVLGIENMQRLICLVFLLLSQVSPLWAAPARLALVIGNADYRYASKLQNTLNDARDIASDLETLGFEVIKVENAHLDGMIDATTKFGNRLRQAGGVGMVFYYGHGIQVDGVQGAAPPGHAIF